MASATTATQAAISVADSLRARIIQRAYTPGQRLTEAHLVAEYGVSRVPVREAIRILEGEGFLVSRPYAGTVVAELSHQDAEDLLAIRARIEPLCAKRAAEEATADGIREMFALVEEGEKHLAAGEVSELPRLNSLFHEAVARTSGSRMLSVLMQQLSQRIAWVYAVDLPTRATNSWAEHRAIVAAITAGDAALAEELMADHVAKASTAYHLRSSC